SERRFGVVRKILDPPGEALPDFEIFRRIAEAWGCADMFRQWSSPEAVFALLRQASRGRPCDFTGIDNYGMLDRYGGIQWPFPHSAGEKRSPHPGAAAREVSERRLFNDGAFFHPDGRARFVVGDPEEPPERPSEAYPFTLLTGRGSISQWHTLTRTDRAPLLKRASPDPAYVEINPADATGLGIEADQWVEIISPRGTARVKAKPSDGVQPGQLFMPMHFNETNNLTVSSFDPYSRQPSFKYAAVAVRPGAERAFQRGRKGTSARRAS
ncbi:MAG TPA: molybdopterin dinucleotide binding domain-containing protein, partial [Thermoleophilia bacterium]|nr:molybdopterin dinucleotide binding domain-containing protein [Thermoleophilia bacterium]